MWKFVMVLTVLLTGALTGCGIPDSGGIELMINKCNENHGQLTMTFTMGGMFEELAVSCEFPKTEK